MTGAFAELEHQLGVLPLLDLFDPHNPLVRAVRVGECSAGLGLFTPNAALTRREPTVQAVRASDGYVLNGRFRYAGAASEASLIAVNEDRTPRLALVAHDQPGLRITAPGWATLDNSTVDASAISAPVSWDAGSPLSTAIDQYAWAHASLAHEHAARVIGQLRRRLAATPVDGAVLSTSQLLAHEVTKLEIEVSLLGAAVEYGPNLRGEPDGGVAVAAVLAAATEASQRTAQLEHDFTTELGLPVAASPAIAGYFGGRRSASAEVAHRLGLLAGRP